MVEWLRTGAGPGSCSLAVFAILVSACGGGATTAPTEAPATEAPASEAPATEAPPADLRHETTPRLERKRRGPQGRRGRGDRRVLPASRQGSRSRSTRKKNRTDHNTFQ